MDDGVRRRRKGICDVGYYCCVERVEKNHFYPENYSYKYKGGKISNPTFERFK
jgi:hypothetical protein